MYIKYNKNAIIKWAKYQVAKAIGLINTQWRNNGFLFRQY